MAATGVEAPGLRWTCDLGVARQRVGDKVAPQATWTLTVLCQPSCD